jgi:hypothetical protein
MRNFCLHVAVELGNTKKNTNKLQHYKLVVLNEIIILQLTISY